MTSCHELICLDRSILIFLDIKGAVFPLFQICLKFQ